MHNPKPIISLVLCMKKVLFLFTLLTIICLQPNFAYADREFLSLYTQTLFNAESGMDANDASSVIQTKDGYLWIASYSGLIRYDGNEFVRFNSDTESGFTASSATTFYEDLHGSGYQHCSDDADEEELEALGRGWIGMGQGLS